MGKLQGSSRERGPQGPEIVSDLLPQAPTKPPLRINVDGQGHPCPAKDSWDWQWQGEPMLYFTARVPAGHRPTGKPAKPHLDFPLTAHATRRCCEKII
jgi:hypothetical protein